VYLDIIKITRIYILSKITRSRIHYSLSSLTDETVIVSTSYTLQ